MGDDIWDTHLFVHVVARLVADIKKVGVPNFFLSLPEGDSDFPLRWRLIKSHFSRALPVTERRSQTRLRHGERGIW